MASSWFRNISFLDIGLAAEELEALLEPELAAEELLCSSSASRSASA
jgi:hypothetical protein